MLADSASGVLLDCNQAFLELSGYSREEVIGRPQTMLHPPESGSPQVSGVFRLHRDERVLRLAQDRPAGRGQQERDARKQQIADVHAWVSVRLGLLSCLLSQQKAGKKRDHLSRLR